MSCLRYPISTCQTLSNRASATLFSEKLQITHFESTYQTNIINNTKAILYTRAIDNSQHEGRGIA